MARTGAYAKNAAAASTSAAPGTTRAAPLEGAGDAEPLGLLAAVASFFDTEAEADAEAEGEADASLADTPAATAASGVALSEAEAESEADARREGPVGVAEAGAAAEPAPAPVASAPVPHPMSEEPTVSVSVGSVVSPLGEAIWRQRAALWLVRWKGPRALRWLRDRGTLVQSFDGCATFPRLRIVPSSQLRAQFGSPGS